jgi:hypothetical protein
MFLASLPFSLDELHDADAHFPAQRAGHHAEGTRGFALARSGENQQQAATLGFRRTLETTFRLPKFHFFGVQTIALGIGELI